MKLMQSDKLQQSLITWFMRRTNDSAVRRVGGLPIAIGTDKGLVRNENQDRVAILRAQDDQGRLFIVGALCDGMGGMASGEECASIAIATFLANCYLYRNNSITERMLKSARIANDAVFSRFAGQGGATLSAFIIDNSGSFTGVNVGDSRIYSIDREIKQLTIDDTIAGQFDASRADGSFGRNELLQFVGMGKDIQPHLIDLTLITKDSLVLLTSDGIHFLPKEVLKSIGQNANEPAVATKRLLELAKWCGGTDNGSIIAAKQSFASLSKVELAGSKNSQTVEVWDAFGEIQLIDFGSNAPDNINRIAKESNESIENAPHTTNLKILKTVKIDKPSKIKKLKVIGPKPKPKRNKQKNLPLGDTDVENTSPSKPTPPQLIVEFKKLSKD